MKQFLVYSILFLSFLSHAQEKTAKQIKTIYIKVKGNCDQCKARIENAADIKGVKLCVWDEKTQTAKVVYRDDKTTPDKIEEAISLSGHETEKHPASLKAYNGLPDCCKYNNGKCETH